MVCIFVYTSLQTFATAPDKDKVEKISVVREKTEIISDNLLRCPPPPPSWTLNIQVMDTEGCDAQSCNLGFFIQPGTSACHVSAATPNYTVPYNPDQSDYPVQIPNDIPCVIVSIIVLPGYTCAYPINSNTCCECQDNNNVCKLYICQ